MNFSDSQKEAIKKRDNYECQFSKKFGIANLTGVPCSEELEVHHKTYSKRLRLSDGITVCKRCHDLLTDLIRRERNSKCKIKPLEYNSSDLRNINILNKK